MITGDFLNALLMLTVKASLEEYQPQRLVDELQALVEVKYKHWTPQSADPIELLPSPGLLNAGPSEIATLSLLLPWSSFVQTGGLQLGNAYNQSKRSIPESIPDKTVTRLNKLLPLKGLSVVESGCFEGSHSISLAFFGAKVFAFDARIENVIKSLVRAWCFGYENQIKFDLLDLETQSVSDRIIQGNIFTSSPDLYTIAVEFYTTSVIPLVICRILPICHQIMSIFIRSLPTTHNR